MSRHKRFIIELFNALIILKALFPFTVLVNWKFSFPKTKIRGSKMKKGKITIMICLATVLFLAGNAVADELYVFPAKGQSPEQVEKDKYDCYQWAKNNTGFDPMKPPQASAPPPPKEAPRGGLFRGAARGAAVGAVGGAIAGDTGKGAAIGAATGALVGRMRRRDQAARQSQAQGQWEQQQAATYSQARNEYNRAYSACLEGKGYTVK
jgi:hypothetical protein